MTVNISTWSAKFIEAERTGIGIKAPSSIVPNIDVEAAYQIQLKTIETKVSSGQKVTGKKIGLTSEAMQKLLGVDEPDYGHLLNGMEVSNQGCVSTSNTIQPKVEAEIAFILKRDLVGPNVTVEDVLEATKYIVASIEIVDSRVLNWKITLPDTVADNASSGFYILGENKVSLTNIDLPSIQMSLYRNNGLVNKGKGDAVLGNPATCVAWLANKLHEYDTGLRAGEVILSGALSAAVEAKAGDHFLADFGAILGTVSIQFK
ncbi:2-keto-4-pentenoate hydratase [Cytobacillus horneckiae]|uniref:2-keto-4-pentenoate hydratase n=1 Tax=Cytobacillus horneckiae TaxID=549687 RepID=UPI0019D16F6A|nr:2-keto-4-pentenoate hydratase [Cytobacillus horneckiae]MBN6886793.1 fumarylacetoacetate hydrolase family protein [Cytobacillus horneckiae]MCM3177736.1 2-keto-4-pentenoate hydratase [Cytobacillus horneckiae]